MPEDPAPLLMPPPTGDPSYPDVGPNASALEEPVLEIDQIQGNILAGFNKDHQGLVFLHIDDPSRAKAWLRTVIPFIATTEEASVQSTLQTNPRPTR